MLTGVQFVRYATVGLLSNVLLYVLYLFATSVGVGPKTAMTILYVTGVLMTFVFNRNWSFAHNGVISTALIRYLLIYFLGFVLNWLALYLLADRAGLPHEWIQGAMILLLAIGLFLLQKFWVFNREASS